MYCDCVARHTEGCYRVCRTSLLSQVSLTLVRLVAVGRSELVAGLLVRVRFVDLVRLYEALNLPATDAQLQGSVADIALALAQG